MSGSIIDARIPMQGGYGPDIGAAVTQGLSNAKSLMELQQVRQQEERANKLRNILGAPGAIDPATGMPSVDAISRVMSVDPAAGIKLGEHSVLTQQRQLQMNSLRSKASAEQASMLNDTFSPIVLQYEEALKPDSKVPKEQAEAAAQKAWTEAREGLSKGGNVPPEVLQNIPTQWNYQDAKRRAMASDVYLTNVKRQDALRGEERREKHDADTNLRAGASIGKDSKGRLIFAFPNAPAGQRLQYGDGSPVSPEEEGGFTKVGTGAGAAKDADNAAIDAKIAKDNPGWDAGQVKLERMRQVSGATNKNLQDPSKGWVILTGPDGNDYQHHNGTGQNLSMGGEPIAPPGGGSTKLGGPRRPESATNQDRAAISNVVTTDYEKELGHKVTTPEEKAERDRRVLKTEDDRASGRVGAGAAARSEATGGTDRQSQLAIAKETVAARLGRPLTWEDNAEVQREVLVLEDKRATTQAGAKAGAAAAAATTARGGNDRQAQDQIAREAVAARLGRPLTPEDEPAVQRQIIFQEDKRKTDLAASTAGASTRARIEETGGTDRLGRLRIARDKLQRELGRELTPADDARVEEMAQAADDQRKRAAKMETPAHAAERDAMTIADKKIADKEAAEGRQLDEAEKSVLRQEARSDPKVAEAARKKGETFGVPDTAEERAATAAQLATGEPITQVIPGWGKDAAAARKQARLDAIQLIRDQNPQMSATEAGVELANRSIEFASGKKSSGQLTTMLGATRQGVKQLDFNIDKTKQEMKKLGSTNLSPIINAIYRGEEKWTGNPAYSSLFYFMTATAMESARILSGGQASIQQLHEGARKEAERWINVNMTPDSFEEVARGMKEEGHARIGTFEEALKEQRLGVPKGQDQKQWPTPNAKAIEDIKKNPGNASMFDQAFGPGAAQRAMGGAQQTAPAAQPAPSRAAAPDVSTMQSATGKDGKKIYWDGKGWLNPDGTAYKP